MKAQNLTITNSRFRISMPITKTTDLQSKTPTTIKNPLSDLKDYQPGRKSVPLGPEVLKSLTPNQKSFSKFARTAVFTKKTEAEIDSTNSTTRRSKSRTGKGKIRANSKSFVKKVIENGFKIPLKSSNVKKIPISAKNIDLSNIRVLNTSGNIIEGIKRNFNTDLIKEALLNMEKAQHSVDKIVKPNDQMKNDCKVVKSRKTIEISLTKPQTAPKVQEQSDIQKVHEKTLLKLKQKFEILQTIGEGSFSHIYLAKDRQTKHVVALKMAKSLDNDLLKEYHCLKKLDHPIIIKVINFINASSNPHPVMVMEYGGSRTLKDHQIVENNKAFEEPKVVSIVQRLIGALVHAHGRKIAHCDLKPDNILYNPNDNTLKLIDFGFAGIYDNKITSFYCGTPNYMSPQLLARKAFSPFKADVWALGVLAFKLLFNQFPYNGKNEQDLLQKIRANEINFGYKEIKCSVKMQKFVRAVLVIEENDRLDITGVEARFNELF